jgi:hypothetical protein
MNSNFLKGTLEKHSRLICLAIIASIFTFNSSASAEQTWRTVEQLSAEDKELFDPTISVARDPQIPYLPAEKFPFSAPYTAEEMGYRSASAAHIARWSHSMADVFGVITSSGYLNQGEWACFIDNKTSGGMLGHMYDQPAGEELGRWMLYETFPPENDGAQQLWIPKRSDMETPQKLDFFYYSPSMRRVRRMPEPRRDQRFPNNAQSLDDVMGRDPWEFEWELLGTDVIHESMRFPKTRQSVTVNDAERGFTEVQASDIKMMGSEFPHYRPDGGVDTWVLKATAKKDWLPDYNEDHLIVWVEKKTFFILRREKYGKDGRLMLVETRMAKHENPSMGDEGYASFMSLYWNVDHDLLSYSFHDNHKVREWSEEQKTTIFTAEFMPREWLFEPMKSQLRVQSPDEFFLRPHRYLGRFPKHRSTSISPEIEARYKLQEAAQTLVFETE